MTLTDWEQLLENAGKENPNPDLRAIYMTAMLTMEDVELADLVACALVQIAARMTINSGCRGTISDEVKYHALKKVLKHLNKSIDNWRENKRNG